MANFIVTIIILALLGAAIGYIVKEKKKGVKCIGCPAAATCGQKQKGAGEGTCRHRSDAAR